MTVTSSCRVSDFQKKTCTVVQAKKVLLWTVPEFLPKVVTEHHLNREIVLPSVSPNPGTEQEKEWHNVDSIKCLFIYLNRTK